MPVFIIQGFLDPMIKCPEVDDISSTAEQDTAGDIRIEKDRDKTDDHIEDDRITIPSYSTCKHL